MAEQKPIRELLIYDAIYIIRGGIGKAKPQVLYIGKAGRQSVTERLHLHIARGRREHKTSIAELILEAGDSFRDWTVEILHAADWKQYGETLNSAEKALIQLYCPRCNRQHMKKKLTERP